LLFVNKTVSEEFPGGPANASIAKEPIAVTKGSFKGLAHETKGLASIYQLADGKRTLRLTEFATSNGPDVHVYLVAAEVEKVNDAVKEAGFIDLGSIKGNIGDQNYDIPADADLNKYRTVSIWCARFRGKLRYRCFGRSSVDAREGSTGFFPWRCSRDERHGVRLSVTGGQEGAPF
jgi:Electron transfer DM13